MTTGKVTKFVGCTVTEGTDTISIDNRVSINKMMDELDAPTTHAPKKTPTPSGYTGYHDGTTGDCVEYPKFKALMGYLSWLNMTSRPDLSGSLTIMAGAQSRGLRQMDIDACNHLIKYLANTSTLGITYRADEPLLNKLVTFSDASFNSHGQSAVAAYVIMLNSGAISWKTWKIKKYCGSAGEAEAEALYGAVRQTVLLRDLLREFGFSQEDFSTPVFCDSQVAIRACLTDKTKKANYFANQINYIKDELSRGTIHLRYCPTSDMLADILTKLSFRSDVFPRLRDFIMGASRTTKIRDMDLTAQTWDLQEN